MHRWCGFDRVMSTPFRRIPPSSAASVPAMRLNKHDLPAPLGPMIPMTSPRSIRRLMASATLSAPNDLLRLLISRIIENVEAPRPMRSSASAFSSPLANGHHLAGDRNHRHGPVLRDHDVVFVFFVGCEPPLPAHERCLG